MPFVNIPGNTNPVKVLSATGTGAGTTTFVHDLGVEGNYPGELYPAVFIFAITDIVGSFSVLQVNLEWSPITPDVGAAQFQTVGTWTPLTTPVTYFACSASGMYRLNCTTFTGGTSFNVYVSIASTMPQASSSGGGGSVTQGTVPWADNITQVAGVTLGATAVVAYGSTPAAVNVPGVNAFITNAGSIGGGVQFADNAASGGTPTGTLEMGWDSVNSKIRALKVDVSQNLLIALGVALPAGTNVIGHVITDAGSVVNQLIGVAGFSKITDGTNTAAVKAASTAAVAADPSLVVALSPNSPLPAGTNVIGHVIVDSGSIGITGTVDVSDRAARLVGIVYGSQSQQLKQTATNFNLQVELATGGTLYDARQIRALTAADVVTAAQGTAAALSGKWPVQITDGTNTMPTGDAPARTIHTTIDNATLAITQSTNPWVISGTVTANQGTANTLANKWPVQITDGTNVMPTGDVIARALFHEITDGVNGPVAVKPASTAAVASDPALVVSLSPNSNIIAIPGNVNIIPAGVPSLTELMSSLILEVRSMRKAIVAMVTESGEFSESDFDPNNPDFQPVI